MHATSDVVVVGGGSAGCAAAYYLARAGVRVTLVEREGIGTQASGNSAGGVNPLTDLPEPLRPLGMESYRLHRALWEELRHETGEEWEARITSVIRVAFAQAEVADLRALAEPFQAVDGFSTRWLDRAEVLALEPRLSPDIVRGVQLCGNGVVDGQRFNGLLVQEAQRYGAGVRPGTVRGLQGASGRVTGIVIDGGAVSCGAVVLATGPWAREAEAWLGVSIPIEPLKGEILRMRLPGPSLAHDLGGADVLLLNRSAGQVWCGATTEWRGFDKAPSESARQLLMARAVRLMPAMAGAELVKHTVGLRPVAPDWLPIIGRVPGWDNVYLATGGARKGILLGPGMGRAIADLITQGHTSLSIAPFGLERFAAISA